MEESFDETKQEKRHSKRLFVRWFDTLTCIISPHQAICKINENLFCIQRQAETLSKSE